MKKQVRLYNLVFPMWGLYMFPTGWLIVLPANLIVDCAVLFLTLCALHCSQKASVMKSLWKEFWLQGFGADLVGIAWIFLCLAFIHYCGDIFPTLSLMLWEIQDNPLDNPVSILCTLIAVLISGVCIYRFDKNAMEELSLLTDKEKETIALSMAIFTAPWLFFLPLP